MKYAAFSLIFFIYHCATAKLAKLAEALSELAAIHEQKKPFSSIWSTPKGTYAMREIFEKDCTYLATENSKIPPLLPNTLRIVSYNVHFWRSSFRVDTRTEILSILKSINASALVLQEAYLEKDPKSHAPILTPDILSLNHTHHKMCNSKLPKTPFFFGNIILTKFTPTEPPLVYQFSQPTTEDLRCFIRVKTKIESTSVALYGTHLAIQEGNPADSIRKSELEELFKYINNDPSDIIIVAADFNALRENDYTPDIWQKILQNTARHMQATINYVPTKTLEIFEKNGFKDSFTFSNQTGPRFTVWTGTTVDFIFIKDARNKIQQTLHPVRTKSYVYYSPASDHVPIILDLQIL